MGQQVGFPVLEAEHPALGRLAPAPSCPQPHQGATSSGTETTLRPQRSPRKCGQWQSQAEPKGEEQGAAQGEGGGQAEVGPGARALGAHRVSAAQRNRHWAGPPPPPSLGADRGWHVPGIHTHVNTHTHTHAHTLPYHPDNLVLKSRSSSESQPSSRPPPHPCLAWIIEWPGKHIGSSRGLLGPGGRQGPEHSPPARDRMANGQGPGPEPAGVPWPQPSLQFLDPLLHPS